MNFSGSNQYRTCSERLSNTTRYGVSAETPQQVSTAPDVRSGCTECHCARSWLHKTYTSGWAPVRLPTSRGVTEKTALLNLSWPSCSGVSTDFLSWQYPLTLTCFEFLDKKRLYLTFITYRPYFEKKNKSRSNFWRPQSIFMRLDVYEYLIRVSDDLNDILHKYLSSACMCIPLFF